MSVAIVDYGSGNLRSAAKAFERMAGPSETIEVTDDAARIRAADRIVLPGVGAFGDCMRGLSAVPGVVEALTEAVIHKGRPFLGICVGMQLMADEGREHGVHPGLGWIPGRVEAIRPPDPSLKVPHMGWNILTDVADHPVFAGLGDGRHYAYFVHGYHLTPDDPAHRLAAVEYGRVLTAAVGRDNMVGTQFHPEKSQAAGLRLIANFLAWTP
ncbi:imidazole glycerol phosphate synthase subunit HisH [Marivibrio halodurans]|uniref:Imidazole glycerol phosphate synthase subunit HisH n=1 Tax=Marivibrio halodurans TaxID=2039722 RepID=A0A8J7V1G3_9PROT|nr:imidazole glycerol phosphate synthase subunit HisH [Marivibrio halodurans]MBP5856320.1 imidazole glycerol phosphate synthase subunit HisH [Marivibrio halodurans]